MNKRNGGMRRKGEACGRHVSLKMFALGIEGWGFSDEAKGCVTSERGSQLKRV